MVHCVSNLRIKILLYSLFPFLILSQSTQQSADQHTMGSSAPLTTHHTTHTLHLYPVNVEWAVTALNPHKVNSTNCLYKLTTIVKNWTNNCCCVDLWVLKVFFFGLGTLPKYMLRYAHIRQYLFEVPSFKVNRRRQAKLKANLT